MRYGRLRLWALFVLINASGAALLVLAGLRGWIELVIERDVSRISLVIFGLFVVGLLLCGQLVRMLNRAFDDLESESSEWLHRYRELARLRPDSANMALESFLGLKLFWPRILIPVLPMLGLLGTVVGIALGFEQDLASNADDLQSIIGEVFAQLLAGLGVAFYTTIVGIIFALWLTANFNLIEREALSLKVKILEAGADKALEDAGCLPGCGCAPEGSDEQDTANGRSSVDESADEAEESGPEAESSRDDEAEEQKGAEQ